MLSVGPASIFSHFCSLYSSTYCNFYYFMSVIAHPSAAVEAYFRPIFIAIQNVAS